MAAYEVTTRKFGPFWISTKWAANWADENESRWGLTAESAENRLIESLKRQVTRQKDFENATKTVVVED